MINRILVIEIDGHDEVKLTALSELWVIHAGLNVCKQIEITPEQVRMHLEVNSGRELIHFSELLDATNWVEDYPFVVKTIMGDFDQKRYNKLKSAYAHNLEEHITQFDLEGHTWARSFAKHMLEYLAPQLDK